MCYAARNPVLALQTATLWSSPQYRCCTHYTQQKLYCDLFAEMPVATALHMTKHETQHYACQALASQSCSVNIYFKCIFQMQLHTETGSVLQVRHFAAHYAGDEGLARPFSAMPSDRNLAWGDQPSALSPSERPATRHRPEAHQSPAMPSGTRQVYSCVVRAHAA